MRKVETGGELIVGEFYWIFPKSNPSSYAERNGHLVEVKLHELTQMGNEIKYIGNRIWCFPGNNQADERYEIFGPVLMPEITQGNEFLQKKIDPTLARFNFNSYVDGDIEAEHAKAIHNEVYRGNEWVLTAVYCKEEGTAVLTEVIFAKLMIENSEIIVGGVCTKAEGIAEARRVVDIYNEDPGRFEEEFRAKMPKPAQQQSLLDPTATEATPTYTPPPPPSYEVPAYMRANEIPAVQPKQDAVDDTLPEIDIDDDEIPFNEVQ